MVTLAGKEFRLCDTVKTDAQAREGFFALAKQVFSLDFEPWYCAGYWGDAYVPHVLMDGDVVAANVSVNVMRTRLAGQPLCYIQLGTVMTSPGYRGMGLQRWLMEHVLAVWASRCDGLYLYANDQVVDFYPRFGFEAAQVYDFAAPVMPVKGDFIRLSMDDPAHVARLRRLFAKGNTYSDLPMLDNFGLLMFYLSQFNREDVYYSPSLDVVAVASFEGDAMRCYDVFGEGGTLREVLAKLARPETRQMTLAFVPLEAEGFAVLPREAEDTTFFVRGGIANAFRGQRLAFSDLSYA